MTEKVVLTKEQAEAIEKAITEFGKDRVIDGVLGKWQGELSPLNDLKPSEFARIMYDAGYEVEPEFEIGDFIEIELFGRGVVVEITGINNADGRIRINGSSEFNEYNVIRKLTDEEIQQEKERRWWKKYGREVWELRKGDVLVDTNGEILEVTDKRDDYKGYYLDYCSYSLEMIKNRFIILTFAESRLDVKTDAN